MPKYNFGKKRIKPLINAANAVKSLLFSRNSGYIGWMLDEAVQEIHQNILNVASSIPSKFNPEFELVTYQSGDMYHPSMPFGYIKIYLNEYCCSMTVTESDIDYKLVRLSSELTRSRNAKYRTKTKNIRIHGETSVSLSSSRDTLGFRSLSGIY